jgi:hypothetical protein
VYLPRQCAPAPNKRLCSDDIFTLSSKIVHGSGQYNFDCTSITPECRRYRRYIDMIARAAPNEETERIRTIQNTTIQRPEEFRLIDSSFIVTLLAIPTPELHRLLATSWPGVLKAISIIRFRNLQANGDSLLDFNSAKYRPRFICAQAHQRRPAIRVFYHNSTW